MGWYNLWNQANTVFITWNKVNITEDDDRGYLIEALVCKNGDYYWWKASFDHRTEAKNEVQDEAGCPIPSSGVTYILEKHGFPEPVTISWPQL